MKDFYSRRRRPIPRSAYTLTIAAVAIGGLSGIFGGMQLASAWPSPPTVPVTGSGRVVESAPTADAEAAEAKLAHFLVDKVCVVESGLLERPGSGTVRDERIRRADIRKGVLEIATAGTHPNFPDSVWTLPGFTGTSIALNGLELVPNSGQHRGGVDLRISSAVPKAEWFATDNNGVRLGARLGESGTVTLYTVSAKDSETLQQLLSDVLRTSSASASH